VDIEGLLSGEQLLIVSLFIATLGFSLYLPVLALDLEFELSYLFREFLDWVVMNQQILSRLFCSHLLPRLGWLCLGPFRCNA